MKRTAIIGILFAIAAVAALTQAYAAQTFKYIMVVIVYENGDPVTSRIFPMPDAAECKGAKEELEAEAAEKKVDVWAACVEVKRPPPLRKQRDS